VISLRLCIFFFKYGNFKNLLNCDAIVRVNLVLLKLVKTDTGSVISRQLAVFFLEKWVCFGPFLKLQPDRNTFTFKVSKQTAISTQISTAISKRTKKSMEWY